MEPVSHMFCKLKFRFISELSPLPTGVLASHWAYLDLSPVGSPGKEQMFELSFDDRFHEASWVVHFSISWCLLRNACHRFSMKMSSGKNHLLQSCLYGKQHTLIQITFGTSLCRLRFLFKIKWWCTCSVRDLDRSRRRGRSDCMGFARRRRGSDRREHWSNWTGSAGRRCGSDLHNNMIGYVACGNHRSSLGPAGCWALLIHW
jgi:hypothetical protein